MDTNHVECCVYCGQRGELTYTDNKLAFCSEECETKYLKDEEEFLTTTFHPHED